MKIKCKNCGFVFESIPEYRYHLKSCKHDICRVIATLFLFKSKME
jgi:hypothetical protein